MCERESEEGWEKVQRRQSGNRRRRFDGQKGKDLVKFFVSNIPDGCRPWDLASRFEEFGSIARVYIARKRDMKGARFGFITFKDVKDKGDLEKKMKGVKLGNCTLETNIARFAAENGGSEPPKGPRPPHPPLVVEKKNPFSRASEGLKDGRSFSNVVKGVKEPEKKKLEIRIDATVNEMVGYHDIAVVARCKNFHTLSNLGVLLARLKGSVSSFQYLGGLSILLICGSKAKVKELVNKKSDWEGLFSSIDIWRGQSLPFERIAWVGIHGVPLHLASPSTFINIGNLFGKVVYPAAVNSLNRSVEGIGILVGDGIEIKETVSLLWKDKKFQVWVSEKLVAWQPSCVIQNIGRQSSPEKPPKTPTDSTMDSNEVEDGEVREDVEEPAHGNVEGGACSLHGEEKRSPWETHVNGDIIYSCNNNVGPSNDPIFSFEAHVRNQKDSTTDVFKDWAESSFNGPPTGLRNRSRESDPFSLNRILGLNGGNTNSENGEEIEHPENPIEQNTLDLNASPDNNSSKTLDHDGNQSRNENEENIVMAEAQETVVLGQLLGVDLSPVQDEIRNIIMDEGKNPVLQ